jgi:energy-converting hydrogenase Eha subunit E
MSSSLLTNALRATTAAIMALATVALALTSVTIVRAQATDPRAQITLPATDQTVRGTVTVQGTATSPFFSRYELAYAAEPDATNWISLGGNVQLVDNGTLGVWNTRPLADGQYALRLQVFNSDGSVTEAIARNITLANAAAVAPGPATIITGTIDTVQGPAVVEEVESARNTLQVVAATLSELPDAFLRGARLALLAFVALGAYVLVKKLVLFGLRRAARRPVDYGK